MNDIVNLTDVIKRYKEFQLGPLNVSIPRGCITGLIGPNGSGKTTTMQILMNIISPNSGDVTIMDMQHKTAEISIKNCIGYVGEVQHYYEDQTVSWTARFVSKFYDEWNANLFEKLLHEFKISRSKKIKALSKGMKLKFSIALALSHNPALIIMDEPTSGLDPIVRREVLDYLKKFVDEDPEKSVIISSHITNDLERIADYIIFLIDGKVVLYDSKDNLTANWKKINFQEGIIGQEIIAKLFEVEKNMFGCCAFTDKYPEIEKMIDPIKNNNGLKIENVGLDDILLCLLRR